MVALLDAGHTLTRPPRAASTSSRPPASSAVAPADDSDHLVLGAFDVPPKVEGEGLRILDIAGRSPSEVTAAVRRATDAAGADMPGGWKPWFPVIDYDRCTNCMQCLTFCLFDVYAIDGEQKIKVQTQDNCKTDCPACSRVCPEAAILFPKYKAGPINGDVVRPEDLDRESMKVDISALLGGDIYAALRDRSTQARSRFSTERDESKALLERKRCLKKLQRDLDIPNEVLMTLPSAGDIEERTRRALEKAERRKHRSQTMQDRRTSTTEEWGI
jgi:Pyruvate/2-oxoacid:ferredoxin oxidoreductase delta subunit